MRIVVHLKLNARMVQYWFQRSDYLILHKEDYGRIIATIKLQEIYPEFCKMPPHVEWCQSETVVQKDNEPRPPELAVGRNTSTKYSKAPRTSEGLLFGPLPI